jgi:hypothetical protein
MFLTSENRRIRTSSGKKGRAGGRFHLAGSHLCAGCGNCVKIFDLRFDAELQTIQLPATMVLLFAKVIVGASGNSVSIREWSGLRQTTTRDLIRSAEPAECCEVAVGLPKFEANLESPWVE